MGIFASSNTLGSKERPAMIESLDNTGRTFVSTLK
ncbi:hypothetical protein R75465_05651 [Paraburkholderia aspalathi]|nr:hypothetical protein R75465_05651 [Paraburkholderia aspalathi]